MNTRILKKIFIAVFFILGIAEVSAWGVTGHRVVAEIAENHLTNRAKRKLKKLIGKQKLAYWANWPDNVRNSPEWKNTSTWHYVNIPPQETKEQFIEQLKNNNKPNIYTAIQNVKGIIVDKNTPDADREIYLRFLVHFLGDMMQPMHTGREEDLGGNLIKIQFFKKDTNLHSLWDSGLIDNTKYSYTEYARVLDVKSKEEINQIQSGSLEDWLYESHQAANQLYASVKPGENYSYDYQQQYNALLERQLLHAGLRLAKILNEVL
jgi:S1/P1 endonuclease family protein